MARSDMCFEKMIAENLKDTEALGKRLARDAKPGDVIALTGDLGVGKTTLTRYIAAALGIKENITSPTFSIIKEYRGGRMPLYHFDVYRLSDSEEMFELGHEEYFYGEGLTVVEWADLVEDVMPRDCRWVDIEYAGEDKRIYTVGHRCEAPMEQEE